MHRRLVRKLDLEILLSQIKPHPSPKPSLEQYTIRADIAATILYLAAYTYNDITDKTVLDSGCGTGRLGLGAAFLGASQVVGVDIDKTALSIAWESSERTGLRDKVQWVAAEIEAIQGKFDTVLQNPPFGVQRRGADRKFLKKALEVGKRIYSLHKDPDTDKKLIQRLKASETNIIPVVPTSNFIKNFVRKHNGRIKAAFALLMTIPHMFDFHSKQKHQFVADLYVIERM
jgi:putative methylase